MINEQYPQMCDKGRGISSGGVVVHFFQALGYLWQKMVGEWNICTILRRNTVVWFLIVGELCVLLVTSQ